MQVFANPECTEYATGEVNTVYVRINVPWTDVDSGWDVSGEGLGTHFEAYAPTSEDPDVAYEFVLWANFGSQTDGPYTAGQVVSAVGPGVTDVTDFTMVFTKP